jgi:hypothetical protein
MYEGFLLVIGQRQVGTKEDLPCTCLGEDKTEEVNGYALTIIGVNFVGK